MIFIFFIGLFIGSFLNCLIYRLENDLPIFIDSPRTALGDSQRAVLGESKKKQWKFSRSFCPLCKKDLQWFELIPILSFIIQKFRCRSCHQKISWQYPIVEIMTGLLFLLIFNFQFATASQFLKFEIFEILNLIYLLIVTSILILITVFDYKYYIIPNKLIYSLIILASIYLISVNFVSPVFLGEQINSLESFMLNGGLSSTLLATLSFSLFFFSLTAFSGGRWMGMGDAKLVLFMGLFLGWPKIVLAIFLSFILGSIISLILIASKKKDIKSAIPFGPFLILGTFISLLWSDYLIKLIY